jgi:hypothetical protein
MVGAATRFQCGQHIDAKPFGVAFASPCSRHDFYDDEICQGVVGAAGELEDVASPFEGRPHRFHECGLLVIF